MNNDMIVNLYDLDLNLDFSYLDKENIKIVRPLSPDIHLVLEFIEKHFNKGWSSETLVALTKTYPTCFIAVKDKKIIGFAAFEATGKAYFGPTGVDSEYHGLGVGKALLLSSLKGLKDLGYTYAIIGGVGSAKNFYEKVVGAVNIPKGYPGLYSRLVSRN